MKSYLASIEIKFIVQATEDEDKILNRISEVFRIPIEMFEKSTLDGHFGNPIKFFRFHISGKNADNIANGMANIFEDGWKKMLQFELINNIDKHGSLFLRIDKQSFFKDKLTQSPIDAVRVKMKPRFKIPIPKMIIMFRTLLTI
ncbi:RNA-binding domain-containing protein [Thermoproteota archaeon]